MSWLRRSRACDAFTVHHTTVTGALACVWPCGAGGGHAGGGGVLTHVVEGGRCFRGICRPCNGARAYTVGPVDDWRGPQGAWREGEGFWLVGGEA